MQPQGQYQQRWAADQPGCLIVMLDQSQSMEEVMPTGTIGAGSAKAVAAAKVLNTLLNELQKRCQQGAVTRPRVDVAVIGYGGPGGNPHNALAGVLAQQDIASIADIAANPIKIDHTMTKQFDEDSGTMIDIPMDVPIWVEPVAVDGTPMCAALQAAYYVSANWVSAHPNNFPPIVVNITDGEANDGDPRVQAAQLQQVGTSDGTVLLFNCHLSSKGGFPVKYPSDASQVPPIAEASVLFEMSSVLLPPMLDMANSQYNMGLQPGARGFVFGGDIWDLTQFVTIASLPKTDR